MAKDGGKTEQERFENRPEDWMTGNGQVVGDPDGLRYATGRRNVDVREVGEEMLRGRHRAGRDDE